MIDFALWGFILGAIGAILSSILAVQQIIGGLRAKSEERKKKVDNLLQSVFGTIRSADDNFGTDALIPVTRNLFESRNKIFGLEASLQKTVPNIAKSLNELIELMENADSDNPVGAAIILNKRNETKPLIADLRRNIEKWLSDHA